MIYSTILEIWSRIKEGIVFSFPLLFKEGNMWKTLYAKRKEAAEGEVDGRKRDKQIYHTKEEKKEGFNVRIHDINFFYYLLKACGQDEWSL